MSASALFLSCSDLKERLVFWHDENCYMPESYCDALRRAGLALREARPYLVTKTMVDLGFSEHPVRSFVTETEAVSFMLSYDGDGDCLHLEHDQQVVGYVDLWRRELSFVPVVEVQRDYVSISDDELPF